MAKKAVAKKIADRPKRPTDPSEFAQAMIQEMTERSEQMLPKPLPVSAEISKYMAELGRRGGKKGGKARMTTMTQEERSHAAYKAVQARWAEQKKKSEKAG